MNGSHPHYPHPPIVAEPKMAPDQAGVTGQCRLRDGAETQSLRGQQEIADIGAAIDRAINPERLVGMNDRDMRRAEEIVILQRLPAIGRLVAARDAELFHFGVERGALEAEPLGCGHERSHFHNRIKLYQVSRIDQHGLHSLDFWRRRTQPDDGIREA